MRKNKLNSSKLRQNSWSKNTIPLGTCVAGVLALFLGCGGASVKQGEGGTSPISRAHGSGVCAMLAINDTYHIEPLSGDRGGMARVRALRAELEKTYPDLLVTHAGDIVSPSFLGRTYKGAHMIEAMNRLDGRDEFDDRLFATFGNHEFDLKSGADLSARLAESKFRFVSSNVRFRKNTNGQFEVIAPPEKVVSHSVVHCGGIAVGLFGLTIDNTKPSYIEAIDEPIEAARRETAALRKEGAEAVVAITHLAMKTDAMLLEKLGDQGPDVILGGHEHERQQRIVGKRGVYKADADGVSANIVRIQKTSAGIDVAVETKVLDTTTPQDPALQKWVQDKLVEHEARYCAEQMTPPAGPKCLTETLVTAGADIIAEEIAIRKYETNFGNWVADISLAAFQNAKNRPQIAFINGGTLRLNANVAKGAKISRRFVEELLAFSEKLVVIQIDGATLQKVVEHSISNWTGEGHFLQISGFSFVHDTNNGTASQLALSGPTPRLIQPNDVLYAVTSKYLADQSGNRDGYTMLNLTQIVERDEPFLKDIVFENLLRLGKDNKLLEPKVEGRICRAPCASR
jgi:2',3'-cyclic-nucleotide 2'-phosphodiesterase (5'-nucleotidase family)